MCVRLTVVMIIKCQNRNLFLGGVITFFLTLSLRLAPVIFLELNK